MSRTAPTALAVLSAVAAVSHEVVWGRLLGRVVGNTAWGVGLALAVFMVGMGAGSLLAGRALRRGARPRRAYVAVEIVVGSCALAADAAFLYAGLPSRALGVGLPSLQLGIDLACAVVAAGVPALAIGATYPFLVAAVVRDGTETRQVSVLYRAGLVGGLLGVLGAGVLIVPWIGVDGTALVTSLVNLVAAGLALWVLAPDETPAPAAAAAVRPVELSRPTLLFASAGLFGLGAQVVWNRTILPYAGVSTLTFAAIVAAYLLAQTIGMVLGGRREAARTDSLAAGSLAIAPALAIVSLAALSPLGSLVPSRDAAPVGWLLASAAVVATVVCPTAIGLGIVQVRALRMVEALTRDWARSAAWVAGIGTIVSALAAALASLVLYPSLGPRGTLFALGAVGALVLVVTKEHRRLAAAGVIASAAALLVAPGPRWFLGPEFDRAPLLHAEHGVQDTIAVLHRDLPVEPRIQRLVSNGTSYSGDSLFAQRYMRLLGHLPALAARGERRALVVCIGTGTTASALLPYRFRRVDAVDISPSVRRTLRFFRRVNLGFERDPRARIVVEDGDRFLRLGGDPYDVITLEPPPPRAPGASALYSREFYAAARERLAPGGVLAQWLPLHGLTGWETRVLVRTFLAAFPRATLHLAERNEAILLGSRRGTHARRSEAARLASAKVREDLGRIGMDDEDPLDETFVAGARTLQALSRGVPVLRCAWPAPELSPLAGPDEPEALDAWISALARRSEVRGSRTSAGLLLPAIAPFVRVREGREAAGDRRVVAASLLSLLRRDPADPYVQYMLGYGEYLERRLHRVPAAARRRAERLIARQRRWAAESISDPGSFRPGPGGRTHDTMGQRIEGSEGVRAHTR